MLTLRFDGSGLFNIQWPKKSNDVIELGRLYVTYEQKQPLANQVVLPTLGMMQASLQAAQASQQLAHIGEASRAQSAGLYRHSFELLRSKLDNVFLRLKADHSDNLAALQFWGLKTAAKGKKISVYKPKSQFEWEQFAEAYIRREESLPPAEQLNNPPLADIKALWTQVAQAKETRQEGRNNREIGVQTRTAEVNRLLDLLQLAAAGLTLIRFNGQVTNELQLWGFKVTAVPLKVAEEEEEWDME